MSNQKEFTVTKTSEIKCKISKTSYDKIAKNVSTWPQWKKIYVIKN